MSIQPNRVIHRIVDQVDRSDWPPLTSRLLCSPETGESLRFFQAPRDARYATPLHFWVHCLRDELSATDRREDLVGAAGHALCWSQSLSEWLAELARLRVGDATTGVEALGLGALDRADPGSTEGAVEVYRMLESPCRRSSVVCRTDLMMAHFWGHGSGSSWRKAALC